MSSAAEEIKALGNAAFGAGKYSEAVEHFSQAIALDPSNHVFYSNRSAAYASMSQFRPALEDAKKVVELKPDWPKGYSRLGAAHFGLRQWDDAAAAYTKGLQLDPSNSQLKQGLADVQAAHASSSTFQQQRSAPSWAGAPPPAASSASVHQPGATGELALLLAHALVVLAAAASLQPFNRRLGWAAFFLACRVNLVAQAYKIYLRHGLPPLRPFPAAFVPWSRQVAASTEVWHLLLSTILMQVPQLWMGVATLAIHAAYPLMPALGARFGGHPLWQRYGSRGGAWLEANRPFVGQFIATAEVAMGFQLILAVLQRGLHTAMLAFVYWSNLRLRLYAPDSRPYHQQTWSVINAKVQPLLTAVPALRRYVDYAVRWFNQPGQQAHRAA